MVELRRAFGLLDVTALIIGVTIGAGIFLVPGEVFQASGSFSVAITAWCVGAALTVFGALSMAELGAMYPAAGGIGVYLREAFGDLVGFVYTWTFFFIIDCAAIAGLAIGASDYLLDFVDVGRGVRRQLVRVSLVLLLTWFNSIGVNLGKWIQNVLTLTKALGIILVTIMIFHSGGAPPLLRISHHGNPVVWSLGVALIPVLWAFDGWAWASFSAEEMRNPKRDLPIALGLGVVVVAVLYVLLCWAVYRVPITNADGGSLVLQAIHHSAGKAGAGLLSGIVIVSILSSMNGTILAGARSVFGMAREGLFFRMFSYIHPVHRTPIIALVVQAIWSCFLIFSGAFNQLLTVVVFSAWVFYGLLAIAVLVLRHTKRDVPRPFRVPGGAVGPILFCISALWIAVSAARDQPLHVGLAIVLIAAALPFYYWLRHLKVQVPARLGIDPERATASIDLSGRERTP